MPSIIAGLMLVLMEVLSDYGASAYLGVDTFSAGIFKTWYDLGDPYSSSALSAILMLCVFALMYVEYKERQKSKFSFNQDISEFIQKRDLSKFKSIIATLYCFIILFSNIINKPAAFFILILLIYRKLHISIFYRTGSIKIHKFLSGNNFPWI